MSTKSKIFSEASPKGKTTILLFLFEQNIDMFFFFDEREAHSYFFHQFPDLYGSVDKGSFLVDAKGRLDLLGAVKDVTNGQVTVIKKVWRSGDGNQEDWSEVFKCPAYPNGIEITFPLSLLDNIQIQQF